jgi:hypothetical protein
VNGGMTESIGYGFWWLLQDPYSDNTKLLVLFALQTLLYQDYELIYSITKRIGRSIDLLLPLIDPSHLLLPLFFPSFSSSPSNSVHHGVSSCFRYSVLTELSHLPCSFSPRTDQHRHQHLLLASRSDLHWMQGIHFEFRQINK